MKNKLTAIINLFRPVYKQLLFVWPACFLIVAVSYLLGRNIVHDQFAKEARNTLSHTQSKITSDLREGETTMYISSQSIYCMLIQGCSADTVLEYMTNITKYLSSGDAHVFGFNGIYGVFDIFENIYLDGSGWTPPEDYIPQERIWYKAAVAAGDNVTASTTYVDAQTGEIIISYSRHIFDKNGNSLAVISEDVLLDRIVKYVIDTRIAEGGYSVLLNNNLDIIAIPSNEYIGKQLIELPYRGIPDVAGKLKNIYYQKIKNMGILITVLGVFVSSITSLILFHLAGAKRKTDELNKKLESLSTTDELTKLNNRRSFSEYIEIVWKQNHRLNLPVTVLMIDIDYFKKYNDSLGHLEGDKALVAIAHCMKKQIKRETDFIARFGGEEFICVLPFAAKDELENFAKTLVESVENMKIPHPMSEHSKYVTISAGMASAVPDNVNSYTRLLDEADKALYTAKLSGRNRVVVK